MSNIETPVRESFSAIPKAMDAANTGKTVGLVSLGCSKNLVDSEVMLGLLSGAGYSITHDATQADAVIVNTCGFLGAAVEESLQTLSEMGALKRSGKCRALVATGCLPQRDAQLIKMRVPEVDAILGTSDFTRIVETLDNTLNPPQSTLAAGAAVAGTAASAAGTIQSTFVPLNSNLIQVNVLPQEQHTYVYDHNTPRLRATPKWTSYLKIAEGCDHTCSFCIIPQLRGPFRSRPIPSIVQEARRLAEGGSKEIVLVAQDSTRYGIDLYQKWSLGTLLKELSAIEELKWLRVLYAYPSQVNDEFIEALCTAPRVARYLDIPLQHADKTVLARMRRGGHAESYGRLLDRFRALCPDISIRTSFIVGFPGETDEQFQTLCDFVKAQQFDRIGVFKYSDEKEALSFGLDARVPQEVKDERYHILQTLQQKISLKKNRAFIGKTLDVLLESEEPGGIVGRSFRDAPDIDGNVLVKMTPRERKQFPPGSFVRARITGAGEYDLSGKLA
ncbi:MAG: ribosomal protein methylthiotransferase, partial [Abditibacteriota bacterium]|nr:ribosomal protein methylthiotransferase [Abditibacteriota bacterium]